MSVAALSFLGFEAAAILVALLLRRWFLRLRMAGRVRLAAGSGVKRPQPNLADRSAEIRGVLGGALMAAGRLVPLGEEDRQKIAVAMRRAGFRSGNAVALVLGVKMACMIAGAAGALVLVPPLLPVALPAPVRWGGTLIAGLLFGVMVNLLPELVVARLAARRLKRITGGLSEAWDLLIVCLQSGLTFERSLQRTVADLRSFLPDLAAELREASLDMSVHGRTRQDALGRLAARLGSPELRDFAITVAQSERHGTPLADALRKLAASLRVQAIAAMQARVARLPVLLILPTIAFVLPGIMVIVGGPAFVHLGESLSNVGN